MHDLNRVLERVQRISAGHPAVVIFDLDSTLFSTQERNHAILQEFGTHPETPAELRSVLEGIEKHHMGWNIMDDLRERGVGHEPTLIRLRRFWLERFFTDDYLRHDEPLPGAAAYVRELHAAGGTICYLTGRDEPNMGRGTRDSLRAHGFPIDVERTELLLKPRFEDDDLAFKRDAIRRIGLAGEVIAAFENEPGNANMFAEAFPHADVIFLETVHSPDPPPLLARIKRLKDFRRQMNP
jgi:predicted secreted acid phosphatase